MAMGGTGMKPWVTSIEEWRQPQPRDLAKSKKHYEGVVMFPTTHDIVPGTLEFCLTALGNLLKAGNRVLVVSKPHLECVKAIGERFADYVTPSPNDSVLELRFTIGTDNERLLKFWENAPSFEERFQCLKYAFERGFATRCPWSRCWTPRLPSPWSKNCCPSLRSRCGWAS